MTKLPANTIMQFQIPSLFNTALFRGEVWLVDDEEDATDTVGID